MFYLFFVFVFALDLPCSLLCRGFLLCEFCEKQPVKTCGLKRQFGKNSWTFLPTSLVCLNSKKRHQTILKKPLTFLKMFGCSEPTENLFWCPDLVWLLTLTESFTNKTMHSCREQQGNCIIQQNRREHQRDTD